MKWLTDYKDPQGRTYSIGIMKFSRGNMPMQYMVYANDKNGFNTHDYAQDSLERAKRCAFKQFGVPMDSWKETE